MVRAMSVKRLAFVLLSTSFAACAASACVGELAAIPSPSDAGADTSSPAPAHDAGPWSSDAAVAADSAASDAAPASDATTADADAGPVKRTPASLVMINNNGGGAAPNI